MAKEHSILETFNPVIEALLAEMAISGATGLRWQAVTAILFLSTPDLACFAPVLW